MVDVDDQVALVQVEEAVDGPALVPPAGRRAADLGAGEQLVIADDERPGVDQVEARADPADGQTQPVRPGQLGVGEDLAQPLDLGRVVAGDQDAVAGRGAFELGLDLASGSPENRSTLSIRRWQVVSSESAASVETAIVGNLDQPLEGWPRR